MEGGKKRRKKGDKGKEEINKKNKERNTPYYIGHET